MLHCSDTGYVEYRSIVKILHSEDCGSTSDGLGALKWVPDAAGTSASPEDCRISRYIQLPSTAGGITAMGIDGADHLWVCSGPSLIQFIF